MAFITTLHWNLEDYGPTKWGDANNHQFVQYIATVVNHVNADIFTMVEVKNSIAPNLIHSLAAEINTLQGIIAPNPWRGVALHSGKNNEAYIVMYRTDRKFLPYSLTYAPGAYVIPEFGLCDRRVNGTQIKFPSPDTPAGGRKPFYVIFQTTDTNKIFSVLSYHAMYGSKTQLGLHYLPHCKCVTQLDAVTPIVASLLAGDFNVDFNDNHADYTSIIALPSHAATNEDTSLKNHPISSNNPLTFRANAYDNIFQKVPAAGGIANPGQVIDLMVESSLVLVPQPPPPAAQPRTGYLSAVAGSFNVADIPNQAQLVNPLVNLPPNDMDTAWAFVRNAISNHYPVVVTTTI